MNAALYLPTILTHNRVVPFVLDEVVALCSL